VRSDDGSCLSRRHLLQASAVLGGFNLIGLGGCATATRAPAYLPVIAPVRATADRIFDITVCLRPFRAQGPRLEIERLGNTLVVHNYGHGGSGWSLSWGSSTQAVRMAMAASPREIAVIGCGALGLTSAILAQSAGAQVTIYARDRMPDTRSARATGTWSPDSRIALASAVAAGFPALWEDMARTSFKHYRRYLGLPGNPVEWTDRYILSDDPPLHAEPLAEISRTAPPASLDFAEYGERIRDLTPRSEVMPPGSTPFPTDHVRRAESLTFNVADYGHTLMNDFLIAGGKIKRMEFHAPAELIRLKEKVVINCPGYGARALWKDESITPVRGQIAWLIPQPEVNYGLYYRRVGLLARRDGIVVQSIAGDMEGYGDDNETPDKAEAERTVGVMAELYSRMNARGAV
jgi:D-amino-acid oxidase